VGALTTASSCTVDAGCQDRPTDDHDTSAISCPAGSSNVIVANSTPVRRDLGCPADHSWMDPVGACCTIADLFFGICTGNIVGHVITNTFNVCFSCNAPFVEVGKLVK
jgi:hypothetical protein